MANWKGGVGGAASGAAAGSAFGPWGTAIGAGVGGIAGLMNDPYGDASNQENKGWNDARHYQEPYWQQGQDQYGALNQGRQDLMDPQKLQDKWSSSYETSPYAKRMLEMNNQYGQEAAASMGLNGSSAGVANIQQGAGDIMQKDRQKYMDDMMEKYRLGIGLGQSMYNTGASAGQNLGGQAMTHGENQAGIAYGQGNAFNQQLADAGSAMGNKWNANNIPAYARQPGWNQ
jgi:hypothetical protein